jgi:hypothetical protein
MCAGAKRLVLAGMCAAVLASCTESEPERQWDHQPDPDAGYVDDAAVRKNTLWLVGSSGRLVAIDLRNGARATPADSHYAINIEGSGNLLFVLTRVNRDDHRPDASLRALAFGEGDAPTPLPPVPPRLAPNDRDVCRSHPYPPARGTIGFHANARHLFVLAAGTLHIFSRSASTWRTQRLSDPCPGEVFAEPTDGSTLYAGSDFGEWGGALIRIDLRDGTASRVEGGNITALIPDPAATDCVIASEGLAHLFSSSGRVLRACGAHATPIFRQTFQETFNGRKFEQEYPFDGLVPSSDGFTAFSRSAYFVFRRNREPFGQQLPKSRSVGGIRILETPNAIMVRGLNGPIWAPRH